MIDKLGPYELNTIVTGDAVKVLAELPASCIDLTVTSPPYDQLRSYNGYHFDFEGIARELYRVTKAGGVLVWVVGDETFDGAESATSFRQAIKFTEVGFSLHDTMIYEKNGASYPETVRYYQVFEYMFVLSKGRPKIVNLLKDRKNIWGGSWGVKSKRTKGGDLVAYEKYDSGIYGVRFNIWRYNTGKGYTTKDDYAYEHPAMFPEALARDHILSWSNPDDIVLDPMCGSGTTCKMAKEAGRHWLGIEISERYAEIARKRTAYAMTPLPLFSGASHD